MKGKHFIIFLLCWGFGALSAFGQTVTVDKFQLNGDTIVIGYDLEGPVDSFYSVLPMIVQRKGEEVTTFFPKKENLFNLQNRERIGNDKLFFWLHEGIITPQNFNQFEMRIFTKNAGFAPIIVKAKPIPEKIVEVKEKVVETPVVEKVETPEYTIIEDQFQLVEKEEPEVEEIAMAANKEVEEPIEVAKKEIKEKKVKRGKLFKIDKSSKQPKESKTNKQSKVPKESEASKTPKEPKPPKVPKIYNPQPLFSPTQANSSDPAWQSMIDLAVKDSLVMASAPRWNNITNFSNRPTYVPVNETSIVEAVIKEEVIEIEEEVEVVVVKELNKKQKRIQERLAKKAKKKADKEAKKHARKNKERPIRDLFKKVEKADKKNVDVSKNKYRTWRMAKDAM